MSGDLKAHATSKDMPPLLPGMHEGAAVEFLACLGGASLYGYDPEVDYRKCPLISSSYSQTKIYKSVFEILLRKRCHECKVTTNTLVRPKRHDGTPRLPKARVRECSHSSCK
jgi:hypothetical protein